MAKRSTSARSIRIATAWTATEAKRLNALVDLFSSHTTGLSLSYVPTTTPVSYTCLYWDVYLNIPVGAVGWDKRSIADVKKWAAGFWHGLRASTAP